MPIAAKDIYPLLGELLHLCQRIEWTMKYLVEQAYRKVEFKTVDELHKPPKIEDKWMSNSDTLGMVVKDFLQGFYGEPAAMMAPIPTVSSWNFVIALMPMLMRKFVKKTVFVEPMSWLTL